MIVRIDGGLGVDAARSPRAEVGVGVRLEFALLVTLHVVLHEHEQQAEVEAVGIERIAHRAGHYDRLPVLAQGGADVHLCLGGQGKF